jgi:hypothetical protein
VPIHSIRLRRIASASGAVHYEPVSNPEFPANREIKREFCRLRRSPAIQAASSFINWDAEALGKMVHKGIKADFIN